MHSGDTIERGDVMMDCSVAYDVDVNDKKRMKTRERLFGIARQLGLTIDLDEEVGGQQNADILVPRQRLDEVCRVYHERGFILSRVYVSYGDDVDEEAHGIVTKWGHNFVDRVSGEEAW